MFLVYIWYNLIWVLVFFFAPNIWVLVEVVDFFFGLLTANPRIADFAVLNMPASKGEFFKCISIKIVNSKFPRRAFADR